MDDLPLFDSPKLVCEGDDASVTFIVLSEKNLLTKIISNITNNQDRFNFSLGCKYFYNVIYGKPNDKKGSGELKFNLSVSLYKTFKDEKFYRYDETKVFKNVIVFNTSTGSQFIWNRCDDYLKMLTRMEYDGTPKLFKKLQRWLMLHNQLITTITLSYEMGCKVSIYKEIVCLLFEKLTNVEKVTLNANLFYTLATYYLNIVEKFSTNKNKVIIEICGDQVDKGGITRRFKLLEWLTPKHLVQLNPTNSWSLSSTQFGNPIGNMSVYKYYQKISNVSMSDIRYHFRDQIQLKEVCIRCDISERPTPYNDKIESFKNVSTFSFTSFCNHQDCILNVLSSFPTSNNSGKNYSLREVYIYCKEDFRGQKKLLNLLCEKFPQLQTLWAPIGSLSLSVEALFSSFKYLSSIYLLGISREQVANVVTFATNFSPQNCYIKTLAVSGNQLYYKLTIKDSLKIKKKFSYFLVDSSPVKFEGDKYEFIMSHFFDENKFSFLKEELLVFRRFIMSNSIADVEKSKIFD